MAVHEVAGTTYHLDNRMKLFWEKNSLEVMNKKNSDRVFIVDGRERIGKSTWVFQQMGFIEPELFESPEKFNSRICIDVDEFNKTVRAVKNGVICFDEGFRGFSSRSALSRTNKMLIQTLMEMGQNNNIVFIVLPSFFLLDIYPAMIRSNGLFHIKTDKKSKLRMWQGFNGGDKNEIYRQGVKKGWKYKFTTFRGRFPRQFPGGDAFEKAYNKKKSHAFADMSLSMYEMPKEKTKLQQRDEFAIKYFYNHPEIYNKDNPKKKSQRKLAEWYSTQGIDIDQPRITQILKASKDKKLEKAWKLAQEMINDGI